MTRIRNLGDLDWDFEPLGVRSAREGPVIGQLLGRKADPADRILSSISASECPVELDAEERVLRLSFLLRLDSAVYGKVIGLPEAGGYDTESGWGGYGEIEEEPLEFPASELTLPLSIRKVLEKVYAYLRPFALNYEWDGGETLRFYVVFEKDNSHLRIINFSRFLEALAKKMSKWYRR